MASIPTAFKRPLTPSLSPQAGRGSARRRRCRKRSILSQPLSRAPHFPERLDYTYTQRARRPGWYRFCSDMLPRNFFRRNVFLSFQEDALGIGDRTLIGVDTFMWGSDYPHTETTFPRSRHKNRADDVGRKSGSAFCRRRISGMLARDAGDRRKAECP